MGTGFRIRSCAKQNVVKLARLVLPPPSPRSRRPPYGGGRRIKSQDSLCQMAPGTMRSRSRSKPVAAIRTAARNKAALVLFGRAVVVTLGVISGALGFLAGVRMQSGTYDPHAYATGAGALFAAACAVIAILLMRQRARAEKMRALEMRVEELSDRNWELREAEERARSLLE